MQLRLAIRDSRFAITHGLEMDGNKNLSEAISQSLETRDAMQSSRRQFFLSTVGLATTAGFDRNSDRSQSDSAQEAAPRAVDYSTVHRHTFRSCRDASLARLQNGDVAAVFQLCHTGHRTGSILFSRSSDDGASWKQPQTIFGDSETQRGYGAATIIQLSTGVVLSCAAKFRFLLERGPSWKRGCEIEGIYFRKSADNGHSWSQASKIDIAPFQAAWPGASILELPGGRLLLPLCGHREDRYKRTAEPISSFLLRSDDSGASWAFHSIVARDSGSRDYEASSIVRARDGRLMAMLRSACVATQNPQDGCIYQTISEDGGLNWLRPAPTGIWGSFADITSLDDGRVLCTFACPIDSSPGIRRCISHDGTSWSPEDAVQVRSMPAPSPGGRDFGCPRSVQLKDGAILTAYEAVCEGESRDTLDVEPEATFALECARYSV